MSATAATHPGIRLTTVQGLLQITNRVGKFKFNLSKEPKSESLSASYIVPRGKILKKKSLLNFSSTS